MPQSNESLLFNLAHELRQPLSTIESIAYYLELVLPHSDPRVLEQLTRLRQLVEQSGWILNDTLSLSKPARFKPEAVDLDELLSEFVLEHLQHDSRAAQFDLELAGAPVWLDYRQGRELVHGICRFFRTIAKPGKSISVETCVLTGGNIMLRARTEGQTGDDANLPPGSHLTLEWIERIATQNSAILSIRLLDPARLELSVEVQPAPRVPLELTEFDGAHPSYEQASTSEPVAQGTP